MLPCEVCSLRTLPVVHAKLGQTSSEFGANFKRSWGEVGANSERSWSKLRVKLERTSSEVGPVLLGAKCVVYRCVFRFAKWRRVS